MRYVPSLITHEATGVFSFDTWGDPTRPPLRQRHPPTGASLSLAGRSPSHDARRATSMSNRERRTVA